MMQAIKSSFPPTKVPTGACGRIEKKYSQNCYTVYGSEAEFQPNGFYSDKKQNGIN
jgi:hypothetical protein